MTVDFELLAPKSRGLRLSGQYDPAQLILLENITDFCICSRLSASTPLYAGVHSSPDLLTRLITLNDIKKNRRTEDD
ncbi:hypothetical protein LMH87_003960 [Akanthomyces muscarius]|uniref:Uncharacterized protein n=1 Tax=Akanthomyces muscarius TaxID=2231603 RepID=A0A9W8Q2U9_AKAMU|nr:hypothetical protein LMH87_003960 [Akanthomyces muscarius]KAJ4145100.1 hypothetical protein LMH87_003960 [Akanthomyces muscarius]